MYRYDAENLINKHYGKRFFMKKLWYLHIKTEANINLALVTLECLDTYLLVTVKSSKNKYYYTDIDENDLLKLFKLINEFTLTYLAYMVSKNELVLYKSHLQMHFNKYKSPINDFKDKLEIFKNR